MEGRDAIRLEVGRLGSRKGDGEHRVGIRSDRLRSGFGPGYGFAVEVPDCTHVPSSPIGIVSDPQLELELVWATANP